jgi:hypothetical protein
MNGQCDHPVGVAESITWKGEASSESPGRKPSATAWWLLPTPGRPRAPCLWVVG